MDVIGEFDVELLAVELEAEQIFIMDGLGANGVYMTEAGVAPIDAEQDFGEFSAMSSFSSFYDIPQDGLAPPGGDIALTGALAEWLDAFINADSLDAKDDLVAMDDDDEDEDGVTSHGSTSTYTGTFIGTMPPSNILTVDTDNNGQFNDEIIVTAQIQPQNNTQNYIIFDANMNPRQIEVTFSTSAEFADDDGELIEWVESKLQNILDEDFPDMGYIVEWSDTLQTYIAAPGTV